MNFDGHISGNGNGHGHGRYSRRPGPEPSDGPYSRVRRWPPEHGDGCHTISGSGPLGPTVYRKNQDKGLV